MKVILNETETETATTNLQAFLEETCGELLSQGVAVAVDGRLVPRTEWDNKTLSPGCRIIAVGAACGG